MINHRLLAARQEKGWSIEVASARVGVSRITFSRWENGHQEPQPSVLELLCKAFERDAKDLGYDHLSREPVSEKRDTQEQATPLHLLSDNQLDVFTSLMKEGEKVMFDPKKRRTLQLLLAAASLGVTQEFLPSETWHHMLLSDNVKMNDATMGGFEKLIQACWKFTVGNELPLVEKLLPECMAKLVPIAQQPSKYQKAAANLTAQGYRLYSILALHRNNFLERELYCKQSAHYSTISGDRALLISSLKGLGDTYYYGNRYEEALRTYQETLQYISELSPLLQAKVYTSLAVGYSSTNQVQESRRYLGLALNNFPGTPESDPSFSYAEFDLSQMILWEGITRSQLGETKHALDIFGRMNQPNIIIPERIGVEIINQQAKTAILSGDLEQGSSYIQAGVTRAKSLGSQRRYNEAYDNYKQAALFWPQEKRVKELRELFAS